jgi:serine/threonine protein phosphatase PrpC
MTELCALQWGQVLNVSRTGSGHAMGFDAFATAAPNQPVFVLCDGANGTPQGGAFSEALCTAFLPYFENALSPGSREPLRPSIDLTQLGRDLDTLGQRLDAQFPDSASTLTAARFHGGRLQVLSVGDSYALVFQRRLLRGWQHVHSLGRHQDAMGRPTELIGAPIPTHPFWFETAEPGDWIVALMTDGAGDFLETDDVLSQLGLLGRAQPSAADLTYCAQCLTQTALSRQSDDDISISLIWMRTR